MNADRTSDPREPIFDWGDRLVRAVGRDFQAYHCALFLHDRYDDVLRLAAVQWAPGEDIGLIRAGDFALPLTGSVTGRVFRTGSSALIPDVGLDPDYHHFVGGHNRSELAVPILVETTSVGVINVESPWAGAFGIADLENLQRHARLAAQSYSDEGLSNLEFGEGGDALAGDAAV